MTGNDQTGPADATADAGRPLPTEAELARTAVPVTVRRAPRYRAFALVGVVLGALVGVVLVLTAGRGGPGETGFVLFFVALGLAVIGALAGGLVALLADRRSTR